MNYIKNVYNYFANDNQTAAGDDNHESDSKVVNANEENCSSPNEVLNNPLEAIRNNQKLRDAVDAKGREMGCKLFSTQNETSVKTDLGLIRINEKIKIYSLTYATNVVNILMFGKSGCGQTTLLSYLADNDQSKGKNSMYTQKFHADTIELPRDTGMTKKLRINESPGMCSGFEIAELEQHWNKLIARVNGEGGVSVFLLLIKSNERITSQFIDELEEFSELYFEDKDEFWKRTIVVFTAIDELKGCNTFEERVAKLETQIAKPGMEKIKRLLDQTSKESVYVSSIHRTGFNELKERIRTINSMHKVKNFARMRYSEQTESTEDYMTDLSLKHTSEFPSYHPSTQYRIQPEHISTLHSDRIDQYSELQPTNHPSVIQYNSNRAEFMNSSSHNMHSYRENYNAMFKDSHIYPNKFDASSHPEVDQEVEVVRAQPGTFTTPVRNSHKQMHRQTPYKEMNPMGNSIQRLEYLQNTPPQMGDEHLENFDSQGDAHKHIQRGHNQCSLYKPRYKHKEPVPKTYGAIVHPIRKNKRAKHLYSQCSHPPGSNQTTDYEMKEFTNNTYGTHQYHMDERNGCSKHTANSELPMENFKSLFQGNYHENIERSETQISELL